jgi:hypothetical protein
MVVLGGVSVSIGVAQSTNLPSPNYWLNVWFSVGIAVLVVAVLELLWALVLYLAHGHRAHHVAVADQVGPPPLPTAPQPVPSERRQAQEETIDKMLGHASSMVDAARRSSDLITAPTIISGISDMEVGRLKDSANGRAVVAAHDRCRQLYRATDGMGVWTVDTVALSRAAIELDEAADRWRAAWA